MVVHVADGLAVQCVLVDDDVVTGPGSVLRQNVAPAAFAGRS